MKILGAKLYIDLKASNVLLDEDMNPKIANFGMAMMQGRSKSRKYKQNCQHIAWRHWRDRTPLELIDPTLRNSFSRNEVTRCIHIDFLCVLEDPADRLTMAAIVLMLNSFSVILPLPKQPAFFVHSTTRSDTSKSIPSSVNDVSIIELYPR